MTTLAFYLRWSILVCDHSGRSARRLPTRVRQRTMTSPTTLLDLLALRLQRRQGHSKMQRQHGWRLKSLKPENAEDRICTRETKRQQNLKRKQEGTHTNKRAKWCIRVQTAPCLASCEWLGVSLIEEEDSANMTNLDMVCDTVLTESRNIKINGQIN